MYCDDSSSCTSSSDEEDMDLILLDLVVKPKQVLGPKLHLEDLTDLECERLFRLAILVCVKFLLCYTI